MLKEIAENQLCRAIGCRADTDREFQKFGLFVEQLAVSINNNVTGSYLTPEV